MLFMFLHWSAISILLPFASFFSIISAYLYWQGHQSGWRMDGVGLVQTILVVTIPSSLYFWAWLALSLRMARRASFRRPLAYAAAQVIALVVYCFGMYAIWYAYFTRGRFWKIW
jgi:hypothetical protein